MTPAVAVIEELRKESEILFIGRKYPLEGDSAISPEYKIITQMGIPFVSLTTGRLQRKLTLHTIPSLLKIPIGFFQALWQVGKFKPDIILSFGGYLAVPVVLAGWLWHVPVVTHEQTVVSGLANRIISFFAQKICVSWPDSVDHFPREKVVLTGNPIRQEIFQKNQNSKIKIPNGRPAIYITGGSLGSHAINEVVADCLRQLLEKYVVIHQCGDSEKYDDYGKLKSASRRIKTNLQGRYILTKYVGPDDIGWVLDKADLVVGRSGANTVTELAALGKPAIFIPLPWAGDGEQEKNAQLLVNVGTATVLPQEKLSGPELIRQIDQMIGNLAAIKKNSEAAAKLIDLSAAKNVLEVINEIYTP